jgi:hypothetical protein
MEFRNHGLANFAFIVVLMAEIIVLGDQLWTSQVLVHNSNFNCCLVTFDKGMD